MAGGMRARRAKAFFLRLLVATDAAAMAEFAIALPLLTVLAVGIFDFGGAFNTKQELNNAVREGARLGASQPTNDLLNPGTPPSIDAIRFLVDSYLQASRMNDCGLSTAVATNVSSTWTYTTTGTCPGTLVLTISRNCPTCFFTANGYGGSPNPIKVAFTQVTISYPYQWNFNKVIKLIAPGANYAGVTQIPTGAVAADAD